MVELLPLLFLWFHHKNYGIHMTVSTKKACTNEHQLVFIIWFNTFFNKNPIHLLPNHSNANIRQYYCEMPTNNYMSSTNIKSISLLNTIWELLTSIWSLNWTFHCHLKSAAIFSTGIATSAYIIDRWGRLRLCSVSSEKYGNWVERELLEKLLCFLCMI